MSYIILFIILVFLLCIIIILTSKPELQLQNNIVSTISGIPEHFNSKTFQQTETDLDCIYQSVSNQNNLIITGKPKVLIVSCYGYGNMGDNMYAEIFTKYLSECEIVKISDHSVFVDKQKRIVGKPPEKDYQFDFLIIGGGGLLTANKLKDSLNMPYYINNAKQRNKPLFIISCGVQGSLTDFSNNFKLWKDVLNYAKLITVRSKKDRELLGTIVNIDKIMYFRDLGYIYPHTLRPYKKLATTITLIVAGPVHDKNETIRKYIKNNNKKNDKKNVVIMNMGSLKDDNNNKRMIKMNFPDVNIIKYYGSGKSPEFTNYESFMVNQQQMEELLKNNPNLEKVNPSDLTLANVINIIFNSEIVFTGRYHGFVFSRSLGIPYDTLGMDTNKIVWEEPATSIEDMVLNSYNNIRLLRKNMNLEDTGSIDIFNLRNSIKNLTE